MQEYFQHIQYKSVAKKAFIAALFIKIFAYLIFWIIGVEAWYPDTDANDYNRAALGLISNESRAWGLFLKSLNEYGLYGRMPIASLFLLFDCFLYPWIIAIIIREEKELMTTFDWWIVTVASIYPTLTFFAFDIYREVPMVLLFLTALFCIKKMLVCSSDLTRLGWLKSALVLFFCLYILYKLRFYLALSVGLAFVIVHLFDISKRWPILFLFFNLGLYAVDLSGFFDWMKFEFRPSQLDAGSSYGIDFRHGYFLLNFWKSLVVNVYGFHFNGAASILLFIVESLPALLLSVYLWFNRMYFDKFIFFLIVFFFIYAAAWVVGIDVLGTAIRYRIFNFLALFIASVILYKSKMTRYMGEASIRDKIDRIEMDSRR